MSRQSKLDEINRRWYSLSEQAQQAWLSWLEQNHPELIGWSVKVEVNPDCVLIALDEFIEQLGS